MPVVLQPQPWTPTTQQGGIYDWARLLYDGTNASLPGGGNVSDWGSRAGITRDAFSWTGPEPTLSGNDGDAIANPEFDRSAYDRALTEYDANPTFTARRRTGAREGWNDDNKYWYETAGYRQEAGPDGQQQLVQSGGWTPRAEQSSWMQTGPDALRFLGTALGGAALTGGLAGLGIPGIGGAGAGAGATGAATGELGVGMGESLLAGTGPSGGYGGVLGGGAELGGGLLGEAGAVAGAGGGLGAAEAGVSMGESGLAGTGPSGGYGGTLAGSGVDGGFSLANAGAASPGMLDRIRTAWNGLTAAQQLQLGGSLGAAIAGGFGGGGGGGGGAGGGAGQAGAGQMQLDIASQLQGLGTAQLGAAGQRQAQFDPQFQRIIDAALASQQTNDSRSNEVWDTYRNTLMPAQQRMAQQAADYSSPGRMNAAGAEAVAGVDSAFQRNREAQQRDLGRAGTSLTSGRALTLDAAQRFAQAKASAGADRVARQGIEDRGIALTQNVANMANPTASLGLNAAQTGLQAGNTATNTASMRQNTYNASLQPGMNALTGASSAAGGAGNTFNGVASNDQRQQQIDNQGYAGLGSMLGTLGSLFFQSDPKTKTKARGKVSGKHARKSLEDAEVTSWRYKKGHGDEGKHIGRMAGKGDPKGPDGLRRIDVASEFGKHHAAIADISKDVKAMRRRLSLADARGGK